MRTQSIPSTGTAVRGSIEAAMAPGAALVKAGGQIAKAFEARGVREDAAAEKKRVARDRELARQQKLADANWLTEATAGMTRGAAALPPGDPTAPDYVDKRAKEYEATIEPFLLDVPKLADGSPAISDEAVQVLSGRAAKLATNDFTASLKAKRGAEDARALDNLTGAANEIATAARRAPGGLETALAAMGDLFEDYEGTLDANVLLEREAQGRADIIVAAARGRADAGDEAGAKAIIDDPRYDGDFTREDRQAAHTALNMAAGLRKAAANESRGAAVNAIQNDFLGKMAAGKLTPDEVLSSALDAFGAGSKDTFLKALEAKAKAALDGKADPFTATDFELYNQMLGDAYRRKIADPNSVLDLIGKGLTPSQAEHIRKVAIDVLQPEAARRVKLMELAIDMGKKTIVKGTALTGYDAESQYDAFKFEHALRKALADGEEAGKSAAEMLTPGTKDYLVEDVLAPFNLTLRQQLERQADRLRSTTGAGDEEAGEPGFLDKVKGLLGLGDAEEPEGEPVPNDPAKREIGKVYLAPDGRTVEWTGAGWKER